MEEGDRELTVEWDEPRADVDDRSSDLTITEYEVMFGDEADGDGANPWPYTVRSAIVVLSGLENGTKYYVSVVATNSAGGEARARLVRGC